MPVKKGRRTKIDADATPRPVKKKTALSVAQKAVGPIEIIKGGPQSNTRVPFRDLKMVIADTLEKTMAYERGDRRGNAEELAHWIAYAIVYEDGGFKVREENYSLPRCRGC